MWVSESDKDGRLSAGAKLYGILAIDAYAEVG